MVRPRFTLGVVGAVVLASAVLSSQKTAKPAPGPVLVVDTVKGVIEIEMYPAEAPKSVARIIELANKGFYRGQRIHWVQPGVVQFGDPQSRDMTKEKTWGIGGSGPRNGIRPIGVAEISKRRFERGMVGLAYRESQKAEDGDSQMFIWLGLPNPALNGKYAIIGHVVKGLAVADKLEKADTIKNVTVK
jgi:peptidyl-prolyl cis-trans isomerase B (cyclophilin B)